MSDPAVPQVRHERAQQLATRLAGDLVAKGMIRSPQVRAAFERVYRHQFVPRLFRMVTQRGFTEWEPVDGTHPDQVDQWLSAVYQDQAWTTQLADDGITPTSSTTAPWLMAAMLEALSLGAGQTVMEIGTGTGYNAALVCEQVGDPNLTTVEIDPQLAHSARQHLATAGYRPLVVATDGAQGHPDRAPYDRIIATCAVRAIPPAWLAQTHPGGLIVTDLRGDIGGAIIKITVEDHDTATGRFLNTPGAFIHIQPTPQPDLFALARHAAKHATTGRPTPISPATLHDTQFTLLAQALLPQAAWVSLTAHHDHPECICLLRSHDGSTAVVTTNHNDTHAVTEHGPTQLWTTLEHAHTLWNRLGNPHRHRFGLTATPHHQHIWLDTPNSKHTWPLPL